MCFGKERDPHNTVTTTVPELIATLLQHPSPWNGQSAGMGRNSDPMSPVAEAMDVGWPMSKFESGPGDATLGTNIPGNMSAFRVLPGTDTGVADPNGMRHPQRRKVSPINRYRYSQEGAP